MAFHNLAIFPTDISEGSTCLLAGNVTVLRNRKGLEYRASPWNRQLQTYDIRYGLRKAEDVLNVIRFYSSRNGSEHSFKFKDPIDNTTAADGVSSPTNLDEYWFQASADASGDYLYHQLFKTYSDNGFDKKIPIRCPIAATVTILKNGAISLTQGTDYSVNESSGKITFVSGRFVKGDILTFGCSFYTPVRFDEQSNISLLENISDWNDRELPEIRLIEADYNAVPPYAEYKEFYNPGGAVNWGSISKNIMVSPVQGRAHYIIPTANIKVFIPCVNCLPSGYDILAIINAGLSPFYTISIYDVSQPTTLLGTVLNNYYPKTAHCHIVESSTLDRKARKWVIWS